MNSFAFASASIVSQARSILLGAAGAGAVIPVCDHYSGVEDRMRKSLQLQRVMADEHGGACVFDVTLDCEDGAPVGGEEEHAHLVAELARSAEVSMRVAARVHPVEHPAFARDVEIIVGQAAAYLSHIMIPKVESPDDVRRAVAAIDEAGGQSLPVHVLIESPLAVHNAFAIAAHPRVQSLSFGLMDFVSAHAGAINAHGMSSQGQFMHPIVLRAKLEIAAACHSYGKTPSHCVVTEFSDPVKIEQAAHKACAELSYTRMWSIHPSQIKPILAAFAPEAQLLETAVEIVKAAAAQQWAPISHQGVLHDRASYRYYWQVVERAYRVGLPLPEEVKQWFAPDTKAT